MTHGAEGILMASDKVYQEKDLYEMFSDCPSLNGKPKLFFIQACRGTEKELYLPPNDELNNLESSAQVDAKPFKNIDFMLKTSDTLVMHSTQKGFVSFRDKFTGSCFIQVLSFELRSLKENRSARELSEILTIVVSKVSENPSYSNNAFYKQKPSMESTLKKLFLLSAKH